ncbi:uncharacterized protein SPSK_10179 [Sporothrix schenckii 1099-18]|uniref:Uncharacterized protein n=1 Tax=Sporothrix schenckii 1099-18 TaxID=1397361 RepID=A0A0F2M4V0_SPOSC|nr:uncharacterized protein SPSK_10179 [Sporothrix schenckii 1099-18]KJR84647.1 hypothetical protein SPSK_10179 [Sporothrix schenckii 1099-18]
MRTRVERYEVRRDAAVREGEGERGDGNGEVADAGEVAVADEEKERFASVGEAGASEAASEVLLP